MGDFRKRLQRDLKIAVPPAGFDPKRSKTYPRLVRNSSKPSKKLCSAAGVDLGEPPRVYAKDALLGRLDTAAVPVCINARDWRGCRGVRPAIHLRLYGQAACGGFKSDDSGAHGVRGALARTHLLRRRDREDADRPRTLNYDRFDGIHSGQRPPLSPRLKTIKP
jgi:hypothetical protein